MDLTEGTYISEMFVGLPTNAAEFRRRHDLARAGILACAPHLSAGKADVVTPSDLVRLFVANEFFVFDSEYRSAFYNTGRVEFGWRIDSTGTADCLLDMSYEPGQRWREDPPPMVMEWVAEMTSIEIVVNPHRLAVDESVPLPLFLQGDERCDLLDRLLWAMCRMMLMAAGANVFIEDEDRGRGIGVDLVRMMRFDGTLPTTVTSRLGG